MRDAKLNGRYYDSVDEACRAVTSLGGHLEPQFEANKMRARLGRQEWFLCLVDDKCTTPEYRGKWYWLRQDPPVLTKAERLLEDFSKLPRADQEEFLKILDLRVRFGL